MVDLSLSFDDRYIYVGERGVGLKVERTKLVAKQVATATATVEKQLAEKKFPFIEVLTEKTYLEQVDKVFEQLSWADVLVIVGIGGSDLGARAVQQALEGEHPPMRVLFHGDSTDPEAITRLFRTIDLTKTVFVIISKSGETVETISQYVFLKAYCRKHIDDWGRHFVFITDPKQGILRAEAKKYTVLTLPIPEGVGGRFSVLTPVGLLAAKAMGVDIRKMVESAWRASQNPTFRVQVQQFAETQYQLHQAGVKVVSIMPYSVQLEEFARWFRQLWAESLGKEGSGILPIQARGPADQHSQLQFYAQGEPLLSVLFVTIARRPTPYSITEVDIDEVSYLKGHSFAEIIAIEQQATALSLFKAGRPSVTLHMQSLNAETLGELFLFFELGVVYLAEMLGINAFDQPGVEESKQMMYALLGRDGFAAKKKEIEHLEQQAIGKPRKLIA